MEPLRIVRSRTVVVPLANVDTDQIIPARFLTTTTKDGLGERLFADWRYLPGGAPNPDFVLNQPAAAGCRILVAGRNFGCGSSREHAVWALQDFGFQAVVAPSFGDIFRNNSVAAGLVPAAVSEESAARLFAALAADPDAEVVVDLATRTVGIGSAGLTEPFELADYSRWRLMEGLDDIGLTLRQEPQIAAYEATRLPWLPAMAGQ
jgi:3-isopropylmalate/(R)-2-methylmalate dehydratase small subunit